MFFIGKPYIIAVYPHEGWTTGGTRVCIVGMNFYEGVEVVFGTLSASAEVGYVPVSRWYGASLCGVFWTFRLGTVSEYNILAKVS